MKFVVYISTNKSIVLSLYFLIKFIKYIFGEGLKVLKYIKMKVNSNEITAFVINFGFT